MVKWLCRPVFRCHSNECNEGHSLKVKADLYPLKPNMRVSMLSSPPDTDVSLMSVAVKEAFRGLEKWLSQYNSYILISSWVKFKWCRKIFIWLWICSLKLVIWMTSDNDKLERNVHRTSSKWKGWQFDRIFF